MVGQSPCLCNGVSWGQPVPEILGDGGKHPGDQDSGTLLEQKREMENVVVFSLPPITHPQAFPKAL